MRSGSYAGVILEGLRGMRAKMARLWADETWCAFLTREARIIAIGISAGFITYMICMFIQVMLPVEPSGEATLGARFADYW